MRRLLASIAVLAALAPRAFADEVVARGNYYRDRNTRVVQPEIELDKTGPGGWSVGGHYLLDTITSASLAAGVVRDQPFTELRNEVGFNVGKQLGPATLRGGYSISQESDYRAQLFTLGTTVDLFKKNSTLGVLFAYGHDNVFQRMGPANFIPVGSLDFIHGIVSWTQALSPKLLLVGSYDFEVLGFGNGQNGFQANPYRPATVGGMPQREVVPFQRVRMAVTGSAHIVIPFKSQFLRYLAFRPMVRVYWDDWGITSFTPELRTYTPLGPVELRITGRIYTQTQASFWNDVGGVPQYTGNQGLPCNTCYLRSSQTGAFVTADPKLGPYSTYYFDVGLFFNLRFARRMWRWFSEGNVSINYGHLFQTNFARQTWGDADLAGMTLTFPL